MRYSFSHHPSRNTKFPTVLCAPQISKQRAQLAVQSAINILGLLVGSHHARRMTAGGPPLAEADRRAHITANLDGHLSISMSTESTSAVGFNDGWSDFFMRDDVAPLLEAGGRAIEPIVNPTHTQPLSARFIDAITWFGEAVRETSPASKIVKSVTAMERLVIAGRTSNITAALTNRAAMLHADFQDTDFLQLRKEANRYYDLRSDLSHGQISPFDPKVIEMAPGCIRFTENTLLAAPALFHATNVLDQAMTNEELARGFDFFVAEAESRAKARHGT